MSRFTDFSRDELRVLSDVLYGTDSTDDRTEEIIGRLSSEILGQQLKNIAVDLAFGFTNNQLDEPAVVLPFKNT